MKSKSKSRSRGASAKRTRAPVPASVDLLAGDDLVESETERPYVATAPSARAKRGSKRASSPAPTEPAMEEMSPVGPLLWLFVPLVLVIVYGALSTIFDF